MSRRYLGYGITNSQGIATLDYDENGNSINGYTGTGAGELDFVAELHDGILLSEIYAVWDTLFAIDGTTDTNNWSLGTNATATYTDEGTHFEAISTTGSQIFINLLVNNSTHYFDGTNDLIFEFDLKHSNATAIYFTDNTGSRQLLINSTVYDVWRHFKLVHHADTKQQEIYINGQAQTQVDMSTVNFNTIGFQITDWQRDIDCWIKNFKLYKG